MTSDKPTKKQHFISQTYLKHWGKKERDEFKVYTFLDGKIIHNLTKNIAHQRYFYEIFGINETEKEFLLKDAKSVKTPYAKELFDFIINNCYNLECIKGFGIPLNEEGMSLFQKNTIETYYGITEDIVTDAYQKILLGKIDEFDLNDYQNILRFAVYQLGRTPKVREKVRKTVQDSLAGAGIRFDRWYTLSMLMTCEQLFLSFVENLYKITVIDNRTSINYITNDNPVFNMRAIDDEVIELFWPVSPQKAILISRHTTSADEAQEIKDRWLKERVVSKYFIDYSEENNDGRISEMNQLAWDNKHRFAFALEERDLQNFILP